MLRIKIRELSQHHVELTSSSGITISYRRSGFLASLWKSLGLSQDQWTSMARSPNREVEVDIPETSWDKFNRSNGR